MSQQPLDVEVEERKVVRTRDVKLSQAEAADLGIEVGFLAGEVQKHKKAAKEAESKQDAAIETLKKNSKSAEVECKMKLFFLNRMVQVFDGEEMIEERSMTEDEFQMNLGEVKHGVVMDPEPFTGDHVAQTPEEEKADLESVMRDERSRNKASLVDLR